MNPSNHKIRTVKPLCAFPLYLELDGVHPLCNYKYKIKKNNMTFPKRRYCIPSVTRSGDYEIAIELDDEYVIIDKEKAIEFATKLLMLCGQINDTDK